MVLSQFIVYFTMFFCVSSFSQAQSSHFKSGFVNRSVLSETVDLNQVVGMNPYSSDYGYALHSIEIKGSGSAAALELLIDGYRVAFSRSPSSGSVMLTPHGRFIVGQDFARLSLAVRDHFYMGQVIVWLERPGYQDRDHLYLELPLRRIAWAGGIIQLSSELNLARYRDYRVSEVHVFGRIDRTDHGGTHPNVALIAERGGYLVVVGNAQLPFWQSGVARIYAEGLVRSDESLIIVPELTSYIEYIRVTLVR